MLLNLFSHLLLWVFFTSFTADADPPFAKSTLANSKNKPTICQFHLSPQKAQNNKDKMKSSLKPYIKIYSPKEGETGKKAFERMIADDGDCDALVISGHHTGDFFDAAGDKAKFRLLLKDLEKASCDSEKSKWFKKIKSLWLLGCNTVTDKYLAINSPKREHIQPSFKNEKEKAGNKTADSNTLRLLKKDYSSATATASFLQHSYSSALDEFTPLSSRYLRMFPSSQIYGFNHAAPESLQDLEADLIYKHITKMSNALKVEQDNTEEQSKTEKEKAIIKRGLNAILSGDYCDDNPWEHDGKESDVNSVHDNARAIEYGYDDDIREMGCALINGKRDLEEYNKLLRENKGELKNSKTETEKAKLENEKKSLEAKITASKDKILKTLDKMNEHRTMNFKDQHSYFLFNNIYETWKFAQKQGDKEFEKKLRKKLSSDSFTRTLKNRLLSPYTASIRKVDALQFYKEIKPEDTEYIKQQTKKIIEKNIKPISNQKEQQVLNLMVTDQLLQYDLLSKKQIEELKENPNIFTASSESGKSVYKLQVQYKLDYHLQTSSKDKQAYVKNKMTELKTPQQKTVFLNTFVKEALIKDDVETIQNLYFLSRNHKGVKVPLRHNIVDTMVAHIDYMDDYDKQSDTYFKWMTNDADKIVAKNKRYSWKIDTIGMADRALSTKEFCKFLTKAKGYPSNKDFFKKKVVKEKVAEKFDPRCTN